MRKAEQFLQGTICRSLKTSVMNNVVLYIELTFYRRESRKVELHGNYSWLMIS